MNNELKKNYDEWIAGGRVGPEPRIPFLYNNTSDAIRYAGGTSDDFAEITSAKGDAAREIDRWLDPAATIKSIAEPIVPYLSAISGLLLENILTVRIPRIEQTRPTEASTKGIPIKALTSPPSKETEEADIVVAKIIDAIIDPQ